MKNIIPYLVYLVISTSIGLVTGFYFREPNLELKKQIVQADAKWRADAYIDSLRTEQPYNSFEYFDFNWTVASLSFLAALTILLFMFDNNFRGFIYSKFTFKAERINQSAVKS